MAPGYVLCMESPTECEFNAITNGGNCEDMCTMLGGVCVDAHDNGNACEYLGGNDDCFTNRINEICVCLK